MIKIGCMLEEKGGKIAARFEQTRHVLLVDAENEEILGEVNAEGWSEEELARWVLQEDCEAILTGPMQKRPFEIVAEEGLITRYDARGLEPLEAIRRMNAYRLPIIPDYEGGTGCHRHSHGHGPDMP
nr:hypothetical protein [uncultured bacterium]